MEFSRAFVFIFLLAFSHAEASHTCNIIWDDVDLANDTSVLQEYLPAPLEDELLSFSSEDALLARSREEKHVRLLEKFGSLLSEPFITASTTEVQIAAQERLWSFFQTLYGIDMSRDSSEEWVFQFHKPRPVEVVAQQFGWSLQQVEALLYYFHHIRIRRFRGHPNFLEAYRQIVDRHPFFGKTLADYEAMLKIQEAREEWYWNLFGLRP